MKILVVFKNLKFQKHNLQLPNLPTPATLIESQHQPPGVVLPFHVHESLAGGCRDLVFGIKITKCVFVVVECFVPFFSIHFFTENLKKT